MVKTVFQLKNKEGDNNVFAQPIEIDINYSKGDVFEYSQYFFNKLSDKEKEIFEEMGLCIGYYRIENIWIDKMSESEIVYYEMFSI